MKNRKTAYNKQHIAIQQLPARFSLRSQRCFRWTGKCFETARSQMQNVKKTNKKQK